eukprot:SM000324S12591  [mRNA]  locus=s324:22996:25226:+ [translate_table: standard]
MLKELLEDVRRGRSDFAINNRKVEVLGSDGSVRMTAWKDVEVGDIVCVECDAEFPADLLCLATTGAGGNAYVETMNLDGETTLKLRTAVEATAALSGAAGRSSWAAALSGLRGEVECERPNPAIYTFVGNLRLGDGGGDGALHHLEPTNLLLRGTTLRNTGAVAGAVLFAGANTKAALNCAPPPSKRSFLERRLDWVIAFQLALLVAMSAATAAAFGAGLRANMPRQWYLQPGDVTRGNAIATAQFNWHHPAVAGVLQFFTALVLYGYFVPISLYVSIEIVKFIQSKFINADRHMWDDDRGLGTMARTSNLNEELGMVRTVLSDKTGTLTRNQMEFFKCSVAGVPYGAGVTEVERAAAERAGQTLAFDEEEEVTAPLAPLKKGYNMRDRRLDDLAWRNEVLPSSSLPPRIHYTPEYQHYPSLLPSSLLTLPTSTLSSTSSLLAFAAP